MLERTMKKPQNLFLVGPMGAGKSAVGRQLAKRLNLVFWDSDEELEHRTGVEISYIFDKEGEQGFRKRESKVIDELSGLQAIVLATGGGAVLDAKNRSQLGGRGCVIYLYTTVQQQLERTQRHSHRPLLQGGDKRKILEDLMSVRDTLYREIADLIVDTDGRRVNDVVAEICRSL